MTCFILEISLNPSNQETDRIKTREFIYISTTDFKDFPWQPTFFTSRSFVFVKSSISTNKTLDHWQWVQRIQSNSARNLKTLKAYTLRNIEKKRKQQNSQKIFFSLYLLKGKKDGCVSASIFFADDGLLLKRVHLFCPLINIEQFFSESAAVFTFFWVEIDKFSRLKKCDSYPFNYRNL